MHKAKMALKGPMLKFIKRFRARRLKHQMVIRIQRTWRMYKQREYSFVRGLQLEKYPVIYYLKEQRIRFADIIAATC